MDSCLAFVVAAAGGFAVLFAAVLVMVAWDWVAGMKAVAVVGPPRCMEGVVERGEMFEDFDEPFCHRMVLQSSPRELGP